VTRASVTVTKAEPGILDPPLEHFRHDLGDPVGELARPGPDPP